MIIFTCGCGMRNYEPADWLAHFRYGRFWRGVRNLLMTKVSFFNMDHVDHYRREN